MNEEKNESGDFGGLEKGEAETERTGLYHYDEAVELTGHGRYNYCQLATCCVLMNAIGVDVFGFGVVLAAASCDLQLGINETALLASIPFTSILFAFPWGYFSDRCGRRTALMVSTTVGFLFAVLSAFSPNWQTMVALKFIAYSFSWACYNLIPTYLGESTGNARRTRYLVTIISADLAAELVFYTLAYLVLPLNFAVPIPWLGIVLRPWRVYQILLAFPLGIGALLLLTLRESPKFLASKGREEQALQALETMYVANGGKKGEYPVKSLIADNIDDPSQSFWSSIFSSSIELFKPPLLWRTLQLFHLMAVCTSTNFVFVMWYPAMTNSFFLSFANGDLDLGSDQSSFCQRIVSTTNVTFGSAHEGHSAPHGDCESALSMNTIYTGVILSVVFVLINLVASTVAKYRRALLLAVMVLPAVCLVLTELVHNSIASLVFFTLVQCAAVGIGTVNSYFIDLYPTGLRGLVTSLGMTMGQLVTLAGVNLVGAVILDYCSVTFFGWAAYICSGIVLALYLPSETKISNN